MGDDPVLLPTPQERAWLLARLRELCAAGGAAPWLAHRLLLPTQRDFPDPWHGDADSLARVLARLLHHAGVPGARVEVRASRPDPSAPAGAGGPVVSFQGLDAERWIFAAGDMAQADALQVVGEAAWAVSAGIRVARRWKVASPEQEARRVDVTAVYLGLGALVTAASLRHGVRSDGGLRGTPVRRTVGHLGPRALAFLVATQAVARELDGARTRALLRGLDANQRAFFRASVALWSGDRLAVDRALGLDARARARALATPVPPPAPAAPPALGGPPPPRHPAPADPIAGINRGRVVFRVRGTMALRIGRIVTIPTLLLGGLAAGPLGLGVTPLDVVPPVIALGVAGALVGRLFADHRCSEPRCNRRLRPTDATCPRCGGRVAGEIGHVQERLEAEERLGPEPRAPDPGASP